MKAALLHLVPDGPLQGPMENCRCLADLGEDGADDLLVEEGEGGGVVGDARLVVGDAAEELEGALAGEDVVVNHATDADHGEATVLDLLELHGGHGGVGLGEAEGVKLEVAGGAVAGAGEHLDGGEGRDDLEEAEPEKHLVEGGNVLALALHREDLVVGTSHLDVAEGLDSAGEGEEVLGDGAGSGEHGNARVLDLSLLEELVPALVGKHGRHPEGVESNVAGDRAVEHG